MHPFLNEILFQFLLGRLETIHSPGDRSSPKRFQFLLGRLETATYVRAAYLIERFNSS